MDKRELQSLHDQDELSPADVAALVENFDGLKSTARAMGRPYSYIYRRWVKAVKADPSLGLSPDPSHCGPRTREEQTEEIKAPIVEGRAKVVPPAECLLPSEGKVRRFLLTCAQNNTTLHEKTWQNLQALAGAYKAEIMVSRFTYNKAAYGSKSVKPGTEGGGGEDLWYDPRLAPHLMDRRVLLAPGLMWCGEMNILPTAVRPLSGLEVYTGRASGIFPHVKIAMDSIASGRDQATKFNFTTGTVTLRNYIQKKAGMKAEFHHCYGALLVEVDHEGRWFCRQLNADSDGTIYDLDIVVKDGQVIRDYGGLEGIVWGDVHVAQGEEWVYDLAWGGGGNHLILQPSTVIDALHPKVQIFHDLLDFYSRSPHDMKDPHAMYRRHLEGNGDVRAEVHQAAKFLAERAWRPWCKSIMVNSNHDNHLLRWLKEADYRDDPLNAAYFLDLQWQAYSLVSEGRDEWEVIPRAICDGHPLVSERVDFTAPGESFIVCPDANGGVDLGMHGDKGPNGARGSAIGFARMGRKAVVGHVHQAGIVDGIYTVGTMGILTPRYARASPSSWSHTFCPIYPNGKRALVTMWDGKWRA